MDTSVETTELQQKIESLQTQLTAQATVIAKMEVLIKYYEGQLLLAKRHRFGSLSEKYVISGDEYRQIGFFNGGLFSEGIFSETEAGADKSVSDPKLEEITYTRKKRVGKREEDLSGLPVERIDHELPEEKRACPECGETMKDIGVDIRRELKLIPAQVIVEEHAAHTYVCENCRDNGDRMDSLVSPDNNARAVSPDNDAYSSGSTPIIKAESPKPLIPGSLASPSLVAHIAVQKYSNGLPLYRIENGFRYDGVNISRQTMANWVIKCSEIYLTALYSLMIKYLLKESVLHADETTVQVLHEPGRPAKSKSYEWIYRTSGCAQHRIVIYDYQETRSQNHPREFLKYFNGFLHTDGYQAYHNLPPGITVVGCWAHARRPWENLLKTIAKEKRKGSDAERGVAYINRLFDLEREFQKLSPEDRYQKRLELSKPIAEDFFVWAGSLGALPKHPLGEAVHYAQSQYKYLMNVFLDGRLEISNNRCERSVKPFVQGRKLWLFSNTPNGATASSVMYSIIETAKENGLHPFRYLKFLLDMLPNTTTSGLEALLPWSVSLPDYCRVTDKDSSAGPGTR